VEACARRQRTPLLLLLLHEAERKTPRGVRDKRQVNGDCLVVARALNTGRDGAYFRVRPARVILAAAIKH